MFYFSGITVGFLLIMAAVVSTRDPRFLYIGGLVLPVSAFLMAVQCRVRREADRRKRHRQLNSRYHHHRSNAGAAVMVINNGGGTGGSQPNAATATAVNAAVETIPLQNITAAGENTLRRQFQGNVYQYVGQRDNESNNYNANSHHYETASEIQQWAFFFFPLNVTTLLCKDPYCFNAVEKTWFFFLCENLEAKKIFKIKN